MKSPIFTTDPYPVKREGWNGESEPYLIGYNNGFDQSWYWFEWWQKAEKEADEEITKGQVEEFSSMEEFIWTLHTS